MPSFLEAGGQAKCQNFMPSLAEKLDYISVEDYLAGDRHSEVKH